MYDINFFAVYKKKRSKSNGLKIFVIVFLSLFIIGNIILVGGGLYLFSQFEKNIEDKQAEIESPATQTKIKEANKIKTQTLLSNEYLKLLQRCSDKIKLMDLTDTALLNKIQSLTPATTHYTFTEYSGVLVILECQTTVMTDPMDMYHAFLNDKQFASVSLSGITTSAEQSYVFTLTCQLNGGDQE